jgi:single-strand DNA-binding protein
MAGINKVIIVGNVGKIDAKQTHSGDLVVNLSIATSFKYKDKSGNQIEQTEWHNVSLFKKIAEIAAKYLVKGSKVYIEGSLKTDKWVTSTGENRYTTKIIGKELQMLSSKQDLPAAPSIDLPIDSGAEIATKAQAGEPWDDEIPFQKRGFHE